jgi:hypothetical protein
MSLFADTKESQEASGLPDFESSDFDAEEWVASFEDAATIGNILERMLDRPTTTTIEEGSEFTTTVFLGQELEALRALAQRLREL